MEVTNISDRKSYALREDFKGENEEMMIHFGHVESAVLPLWLSNQYPKKMTKKGL